jgi:pantoate--beta-alanine ligase
LKTQILESIFEWRKVRTNPSFSEKSIGFVPTMGALHAGHESLLKRSVSENDITIASIYVNPTQFNDPNDLKNYPKTFNQDLEMLERNGVEYLFFPKYDDLYPDNYTFRVTENDFSKILCGAHRPNHFDGVLSVVLKLLNIVSPHRAYFGEKDYQQYKLIESMCKAFFLDVEIIPSPTIRENDGLAMSSRNLLLSSEARTKAAAFPKLLMSSKSDSDISNELELLGFRVDYIQSINGRRFGAVHIGNVRLIDNVQL